MRKYLSSEKILICLLSDRYNLYDCKNHGLYQVEKDSTDTLCNICGKQGKLLKDINRLKNDFKVSDLEKSTLDHIFGNY